MQYMKKLILIFSLLIAGIVTVNAQSKAQLAKFADEVTTAFSLGELANLESKNMRRGYVRLVIENSIGEPESQRFRFTSFKTMARWFKKGANESQAKTVWPLVNCGKGECSFFLDGGILHNHYYLIGISYGYRNKRLYLKSIDILAG